MSVETVVWRGKCFGSEAEVVVDDNGHWHTFTIEEGERRAVDDDVVRLVYSAAIVGLYYERNELRERVKSIEAQIGKGA